MSKTDLTDVERAALTSLAHEYVNRMKRRRAWRGLCLVAFAPAAEVLALGTLGEDILADLGAPGLERASW